MRRLPSLRDRNLLVGAATADDAGVYQIDRDRALVQTVDFFTPIVDDPFIYGQIAATNALSDIYAMGGRPLTAMNLLAIPDDLVPPPVINAILRGGASKTKQAKCVLVGGHTIRNPEPVYGLSVTGLVSPRRIMTNASARPGDWLVLTKPLGTGIATTGIKRNLASAALAKKTVRFMLQLNQAGPELAELGLVQAAIDITGFGLLGHLGSMCRASAVGAVLHAPLFPSISPEILALIHQDCIPGGTRNNLKFANTFTDWDQVPPALQILAADAQTSGGLLLCVKTKNLPKVFSILRHHRTPCAAILGRIEASKKPRIHVANKPLLQLPPSIR